MHFGHVFMHFWHGCYGKAQPVAPIKTFARFQAGFLSSDDFHHLFHIFIEFHRFAWISTDFHVLHGFGAWMFDASNAQPAAPMETCARFQAGFFIDFHGFA